MANRPLVIGICGSTGLGKTTITDRIIQASSEDKVVALQQDNYYRDLLGLQLEERRKQNFDHPDSKDMPLLVEHIRRLRQGETIERPTYDFTNYRRLPQTVSIGPKPALITVRPIHGE